MESDRRFFFVLGMPRCRTAWLSVLLTGPESFCFHEGAGRCATFREYAAMLRGRPERCVGDSWPAPPEWMDPLIAEFPDARFVVIRRDAADALESFCAAAPSEAATIRAGWSELCARFESAASKVPAAPAVSFESLSQRDACAAVVRHLLGTEMDGERWRQLRGMRITTTFPESRNRASSELPMVSVNVDGFDFSGLSVRSYEAQDRGMISEWWAYHKDTPMREIRLPPLGLVVQDEAGAAAAIWCYETFGTGVAWVAAPITRPGLTYARASTVLAFGIMAITQLAGCGHEPRAHFTCFRVICPSSMGRLLKRLGFTEQPGRSNYFLSL